MKHALPKPIVRYIVYFAVGVTVELVRLIGFSVLEGKISSFWANLLSLPVSIVVSFVLHNWITWRDRTGSVWFKAVRFVVSKWGLWLAKVVAFPLFATTPLLSCPFRDLAQIGAKIVGFAVPSWGRAMGNAFTCGWMSVALMDLLLAFVVGYLLHDRFSFWERKEELK